MTNKTIYVSRSIRMPLELYDKLNTAALKTDRSANYILVKALESFLLEKQESKA